MSQTSHPKSFKEPADLSALSPVGLHKLQQAAFGNILRGDYHSAVRVDVVAEGSVGKPYKMCALGTVNIFKGRVFPWKYPHKEIIGLVSEKFLCRIRNFRPFLRSCIFKPEDLEIGVGVPFGKTLKGGVAADDNRFKGTSLFGVGDDSGVTVAPA